VIRRRVDLAVYGRDGLLRLEVEVKTRPGASPEWAARLLRNMIVHQAAPFAPRFMLVLPDKIYLWNLLGLELDSDFLAGGVKPDYELDAARVLGPYLVGGPSSLHELGEDGLELVVASWLTDLLNSDLSGEEDRPDARWLLESGLYDEAKGGSVATEALLP
jgi:hypothetical protein